MRRHRDCRPLERPRPRGEPTRQLRRMAPGSYTPRVCLDPSLVRGLACPSPPHASELVVALVTPDFIGARFISKTEDMGWAL